MRQNWCEKTSAPLGSEAFRGDAMALAFGKFAETLETPQAKMIRAKNRIDAQNKAFADAVNLETRERMKTPFCKGMSYREVRALVLRDMRTSY